MPRAALLRDRSASGVSLGQERGTASQRSLLILTLDLFYSFDGPQRRIFQNFLVVSMVASSSTVWKLFAAGRVTREDKPGQNRKT